MLTPGELGFVLRDCQSVALFTGGDKVAAATAFESLLAEGDASYVSAAPPKPRDTCTIGYTSGTTGYPKGAMQSHQAILLNCALTATMHGRVHQDVVVTSLPAPHVYGNVVINGTFLAGGTVVLMERFTVETALLLIGKHKATLFEGVPAMYAAMLADPALQKASLSSLTRCTVGGQTMPIPTIERWQKVSGAPLLELWGMTEIGGLGTTHALHAPNVPGSIGVSLPGIECRIADLTSTAKTAAPGVPGELMVRGPIVMNGYHGNARATAETIEADGWMHTGDLAYASEDGHIFVVDRLKDMIIAFTDGRLAAYKRPRLVRFVADLPKTSSGKIMRRELIKSFKALQ
jgi:long-chain acyl-CoA synthetase